MQLGELGTAGHDACTAEPLLRARLARSRELGSAGQGWARLLRAQETPSRGCPTAAWSTAMPAAMLGIQAGSQGASAAEKRAHIVLIP